MDEAGVDEAMADDADETLALLADLTGATDPALRELARRLAGRLFLDLARRGPNRSRGIGRMVSLPYRDDGSDVDLDASLDALNEARGSGGAIDPERLRVRAWTRPGTAFSVLLDRSGSMGGRPLATSAMTAAAIAARSPDDYSVLAFCRDVVVAKSQDRSKASEQVINDVLSLRGFGTTDLAGALVAASTQLARSRAARRITVLLSDCRATVHGDPERAASGLDELVIVAPEGDDLEARAFAARVGARITTVAGPSEIPDALARVLDP